ncbi:capsule-associated protein CAP1 [Puccinia graminis f. sp. tritici]|uniref:Capsule-associated protein CAP1 n=1 Tax=Puccinia graminis f. sp. tritici TaxID=56615 RepID=A0A5B0PHL4_PUCGR|nr:capsule-associated protein CAP1 [Puccinia graminis f. sp. tritici]
MSYQPIQATHNHQHLVPPRSRKCNLLLLTLIPIIFCLSSLSFIAFKQSHSSQPTLISSPSLYSLKLFDHHQLKSQAKQLSSDLLSWLDSVHNPLRLPYSSTSDYDPDQDNPLLNPPNDQSPHPILPLLLNSRQSWKSILHSQPLSLQQARLDYEQNFHPLQPPPGFDQWFQFARLHNFTLINRFDSLMSDLEPFRKLAPTELSRRTQELVKIPGITLVKINPDSSVQTSSPSGRFAAGHALQQIIDRIHSQSDFKLPPLELAINENSEARVLPRQTRPLAGEEFSYLSDEDRILYDQQDPEKKPSLAGFKPQWGQDGNVWDAYRRACPSDSAARRLVETIRSAESLTGAVAAGGGLSSLSSTQTHLSMNRPTRLRALHPIGTAPLPSRRELTFLSELESAASFCERPSTHRLHSAFFADQRSIEHLYPLFSPSKPQGFADILIPSYYHYSPRAEFVYESDYKSGRNPTPADIPWNQKANKMYWHGKLTRGADTPPGHTSSFQKQRLVKLVSNDTESAASLTSMAHKQGETDPSWRSETSRVLVSLNVTSENLLSVSAPATVVDPLMLDIAMACDPKAGECHELLKQGYHIQPPAPLSECWKAKMTLDLDDAGFSPRFSALMESHSAVVKMSVHQEFWRDWVQPWYHFIPLSSSYAELHNLVTFFMGIPEILKEQVLPIKKESKRKKLGKRSVIPDGNQQQQQSGGESEAKSKEEEEEKVTTGGPIATVSDQQNNQTLSRTARVRQTRAGKGSLYRAGGIRC